MSLDIAGYAYLKDNVNPEFFLEGFIFAKLRKFCENKILANRPNQPIPIRENKILSKISEFTVTVLRIYNDNQAGSLAAFCALRSIAPSLKNHIQLNCAWYESYS